MSTANKFLIIVAAVVVVAAAVFLHADRADKLIAITQCQTQLQMCAPYYKAAHAPKQPPKRSTQPPSDDQ